MLEMCLKFAYNTCGSFTKNKERMQKVLSVQVIFIMKNYRNPAFEMIWVMEISRTRLEEQLLIKYSLLPNGKGKLESPGRPEKSTTPSYWGTGINGRVKNFPKFNKHFGFLSTIFFIFIYIEWLHNLKACVGWSFSQTLIAFWGGVG